MKKFSLIVLMLVCLTGTVYAEDIGYVDMEQVFVSYKETKKAQKIVKEKQEKLKKEIEKRQKKIEKPKNKGKSNDYIKDLVEEMDEELEPKRQELIAYNVQTMSKIKHLGTFYLK